MDQPRLDLLQPVRLLADIPADETTERPPHVRIMTIHWSKGREFPVVFIPEVRTPAMRQDEPEYIVAPRWGLDVKLSIYSLETRSTEFMRQLGAENRARLEEEMRIGYVAVTCARVAVILIGNAGSCPDLPISKYYAWKNEVMHAWDDLERLGARCW